MIATQCFIYYAGPIPYTLQSNELFYHRFEYKRTRGKQVFCEVIYLNCREHGQQLLDIWNAYAKQSGSNWEYTSA
jgi:hypothetical protein